MRHQQTSTRVLAFAVLLLTALAPLGCAHPLRRQQAQTLRSVLDPTLVLNIDRSFRPLRPLRFPLESLTNVDRRIFVDADGRRAIRRLVIVQFETVQPGASFRFAYPPRPPAAFGARTYRFGAYVHDDEAEAAKSPTREAGLTRTFLLAAGYAVPKVFRVARLARVADRDGLAEVIIFYMEAADADFPIRPFPGADEDGDVPLDQAAAQSLFGHLKLAVTPVSG